MQQLIYIVTPTRATTNIAPVQQRFDNTRAILQQIVIGHTGSDNKLRSHGFDVALRDRCKEEGTFHIRVTSPNILRRVHGMCG